MILYATKQTVERYKLKMPNELTNPIIRECACKTLISERNDTLLEWGAKLFYFDRRKCIQVVNFASKLTFFLVDIKIDDIEAVGDMMAQYMLDLYADNKTMTKLLKRLFNEHPMVCFAKLVDKSAIASLNRMQSDYLMDGYRLYEYIENGILQTRKINKEVNRSYPVSKKMNGKTEYFFPADRFEALLKEYYS